MKTVVSIGTAVGKEVPRRNAALEAINSDIVGQNSLNTIRINNVASHTLEPRKDLQS